MLPKLPHLSLDNNCEGGFVYFYTTDTKLLAASGSVLFFAGLVFYIKKKELAKIYKQFELIILVTRAIVRFFVNKTL